MRENVGMKKVLLRTIVLYVIIMSMFNVCPATLVAYAEEISLSGDVEI